MRTYEVHGESTRKREVEPFQSEDELEDVLHRTPRLLLDEELLVIGRQVGVEAGRLDLLALDSFGNTVVFELKKGASGSGSASEGSILSQPQEYAQSLQWFSYDDLNDVCEEYRSELVTGQWSAPPLPDGDSLVEVFGEYFGTPLDPNEFNQNQRMVIVAESVSDQTATNARYLRKEGLNLQCVEAQRFCTSDRGKDGSSTLVVASTVIDYDRTRIRTTEGRSPTYPEVTEDVLERIFSAVREETNATSPDELLPGGFDVREPRLISSHPDHPDAVRYALRLKPFTEGRAMLSIDVTTRGLDIGDANKNELADRVRSAETEFECAGFDVHYGRNTFRIVTKKWDVDTVAQIRDEAFVSEFSEHLATLVQIGHEVFVEADAETVSNTP